ncbi:hypothetical protein [Streptomyces sp. NPDC086519]|uniref:hypothetical protein n=1 Tax=Streptomyces sp. NPDC086519 TaxID=3154863 RepID=UPI00342D73BB
MDERRDPPPDGQDAGQPPLASAGSRLSPVQEAYAAYTRHAIACDDCRDPGRACEVAGVLWGTYMGIANRAARQVG